MDDSAEQEAIYQRWREDKGQFVSENEIADAVVASLVQKGIFPKLIRFEVVRPNGEVITFDETVLVRVRLVMPD